MSTKILMRRGLKADLPSLDEGEYGLTTDTKEIYVGSSEGNLLITTPSGAMMDYAGATAPPGWMMCDGSAISRTTYANLFAAVGTSYGVGNGSTTFNLPDFRGRFARYNDNMGTAAGAAGRDTFARNADKSQGQATAKNGLSNSSSSISGTYSRPVNVSSNWSGWLVNDSAANRNHAMTLATNGTMTGTAAAQTITGDAETRPINLACNKIIKI